jgi:hypothetical protein
LLNPKLKERFFPPTFAKSAAQVFPSFFITIGPKFLRRLFGEMDVTLIADLRKAIDWLGTGNLS